MFKINKWTSPILAMALAISLPLTVGAESQLIDTSKIKEEKINFTTETVHLEDVVQTESGSGYQYYPMSNSVVYEGEDAVVVRQVALKDSKVKEGDVIFELTRDIDEIEKTELEIKLQRANEALVREQKNYQKKIAEWNTQYAEAQDSYQQRKAAIQIQITQIELQQYVYTQNQTIAALQEELQKLEDAETIYVRATADGTVSDIVSIEEGETLKKGTVVCTIRDDSIRMIRMIDDTFAYGQNVTVSLSRATNYYQNQRPGYNQNTSDKVTMSGRVVVSSMVIPNSSAKYAVIEVNQEEAGSSANKSWQYITLTCETAVYVQVPVVSNAAVDSGNGKSTVTFLDENGGTHVRYVSTVLFNRSFTWIGLGAKVGDTVIIPE